jgi:hypothetical protein
MNEEELRGFEQQLRDVLSAGSLGWVVDQVDELIAEGVYEVAAKRKGAPEVREEVKRPSDARRGASSVRPYTVHERVGLLLACARRALLDDQRLYERAGIGRKPCSVQRFCCFELRSVRLEVAGSREFGEPCGAWSARVETAPRTRQRDFGPRGAQAALQQAG